MTDPSLLTEVKHVKALYPEATINRWIMAGYRAFAKRRQNAKKPGKTSAGNRAKINHFLKQLEHDALEQLKSEVLC